jgi:hypothetical protein
MSRVEEETSMCCYSELSPNMAEFEAAPPENLAFHRQISATTSINTLLTFTQT